MPEAIAAPVATPAPQTATPPAAPPMTARERSNETLRRMAETKPEGDDVKPVGVPDATEKAKGAAKPVAEIKKETPNQPAKQEKESPDSDDLKVMGKTDKAPTAWQIANKWKSIARTQEQKAAELEKKLASTPDPAPISQRAEKAEVRLKELEDEIRHVNYAKSQEYREKYQAPYEAAWTRAVSDMKELSVVLEDGSSRPGDANDLLMIANLPLGEARKRATEMFGDSSSDVMMHRQKVKELSEAQHRALQDAQKTGAEREKQMIESRHKLESETSQLWQQFKQDDEGKYDFLKSKEGDDEWNSKLESSRKFVDGVFSTSVTDPRLSSEQRAEAVRKHAAVRGRAIAYTMMRLENKRISGELAKARKALGEYSQGEPNGGNGKSAQQAPVSAMGRLDQAMARLKGLAS